MVAAATLTEGVAHVRYALGVDMPFGGAHPLMGTHNHLMRIGADIFLEVIAVDPAAPPPARARWFGLDRFAGPPRLWTWVARSGDLTRDMGRLPAASGAPITGRRGALEWRITVPEDGTMPFGGAFPTVLEWPSRPYPGAAMVDLGCRLQRLVLRHPEAAALDAALQGLIPDPRIVIELADAPGLSAEFETPEGVRRLD